MLLERGPVQENAVFTSFAIAGPHIQNISVVLRVFMTFPVVFAAKTLIATEYSAAVRSLVPFLVLPI